MVLPLVQTRHRGEGGILGTLPTLGPAPSTLRDHASTLACGGWLRCRLPRNPGSPAAYPCDLQLAVSLGIEKNVLFTTSRISRNFMPYLLAACDIYAAPARLEGFGMIQVEANARGKPVISIKAMGPLDTMVHGKTAFLAEVTQEIRLRETILGDESGYEQGHKHVFKRPRIVDCRGSVHDIANYLMDLMKDKSLRDKMGQAGRERVVELFDYRVVAKRFVKLISEKQGLLN
jgi:glycosyltransferase involved in cell wall biosynthesis